MRSRLLRPSWLALHVLAAVTLVVMVRLGFWQWDRGAATDSLRNYSYGLEWWAFAGLSLVGYVKICWDETSGDAAADYADRADRAGPARPEPAVPAAPLAPLPVVDPDDDPELAAWNARLAELARKDAGSGSGRGRPGA